MNTLICPLVMSALIAPMILISPTAQASENVFSAHRDNYLLPYYKESNVNQARFAPLNPNDSEAKDTFVQFQFSVKYRILRFEDDGLYMAYTQRSNWEAYDSSAYFRDSNYNPELFYQMSIDPWQFSLGAEHESNGAGGDNEVSWNRAYVDIKRNFDWGYIRFKPWFRFGSVSYNPNITDYLGYGETELGWRPTENQEVKVLFGNLFAKDLERGYYRLSWNVPIYQGLRGYMKVETGYGLTISNYNFKESAYGMGVAFNF
ncbi:phospholipase [Enterovibrio norvegicus FF-162]|uniref:Phospholipase A1 n=1 Tax=Enterovibrio norvegicus FF-454 TaxID=1185651 RepID=A0A1E5BWU1_9GAMM|nr:phospholipase A [Enterovibrio norvegicus]OEE57697.1 phospholipase [Enterovibrio norvegicus FF-454]OEE82738.1 phospholipase [Enterovibrio norvegicus FF-162]